MRSSDSLLISMTHKSDVSFKKSNQLFGYNSTEFIFILSVYKASARQ
jgi:hypothetical protein